MEATTVEHKLTTPVQDHDETGFDRRSRMVLGFAVLVLLLSLAQTLYHFTLPTDGWDLDSTVDAPDEYYFAVNRLGEPTPLQVGDVLLRIEGQTVEQILSAGMLLRPERPANWQAGKQVSYTVRRDRREIDLAVTLKTWSNEQVAREMVLNLLSIALAPIQLAIGGFVFFRRPRSRAARLLFLYSIWLIASLAITGAATTTSLVFVPDIYYVAAYYPMEFFANISYVIVTFPIFVHLLLVFPVVKAPMRNYPRLTLAILYGSMSGIVLMLILGSAARPMAQAETLENILLGSFVLLLMIGLGSAGHTLLTARDPVKRAQIRWVAWGAFVSSGYLIAGMIAILLNIPIDTFIRFAPALFFAAFPFSLAVAILRFRLFDIDVIINRTLVYGTLTTLLALIYFGSVVVLQRLLAELTGGGGSDLAVVGSTLSIAALFQPLRRGLQSTIDRRFYRSKYDAVRTLQQFSASLRDEVDLQALTQNLLTVVDATMQPESVSLWLKRPTQPTNQQAS
jgi:hypothetical protein